MKEENDKKQNPQYPKDRVEIVAENLPNNQTAFKEIEKNIKLLDAIDTTYNRQLDKILSKIIRVMNKIKGVCGVNIKKI